MKYIVYLIFLGITFSCNSPIVKKTGRIDIELVVYNDPQHNVYDMTRMPVSTMFYNKKNFIEVLPPYSDSILKFPYVVIKNEKYALLNDLKNVNANLEYKELAKKDVGIKWIQEMVKDYNKREDISDTIFNNFKYKRFVIKDKEQYTVFYINQTDTILPFSLSKQIDKDYKGVLNRIDTYEINNDRFVSLRLFSNDTIPKQYYTALKSL